MKNRDLAILAGLALLLYSKRSKGSTTTNRPSENALVPKPSSDFAALWADRCNALMKRARTGASWAPRMAKLLGSDEAGAAAARWIGIESGGDPRAESKLGERGLAQVMVKTAPELGLTKLEIDKMTSARTTDDEHARLAAKVIVGTMLAASGGTSRGVIASGPPPGWGPAILMPDGQFSVNGIGVAKLRHALPLMLKELILSGIESGTVGHMRSTIPLTLRSALTGAIGSGTPQPVWTPSARLAAFVKGAHALTGNPAADLFLRFLTSAAVVAHAEDAIAMGETIKGKV